MSGHTRINIDVVLFDLGGVLVEVAGVGRMLEWLGDQVDADEMWRRWLHSSAVTAFESGRSSAAEFAAALVDELALPVAPAVFLEEFPAWVARLYPGTHELIAELADRYHIACLSNTNELHWPRMEEEFGLGELLQSAFLSYRMGLLKPDPEVFHHVAAELDRPAERILFLDDNILNVEAARAEGLHAYRVRGVDEAQRLLSELKLIGSREG